MFGNITVKDVKKHVGSLVKTMRQRDAITQEELAEKLDLSRITIQNLEAGKNPTIDTVLKVFQYFDLLAGFDSYVANEIQNNGQQSLY